MPLFQKSVISKYLQAQNKDTITSKWNLFRNHFLNPNVQEDIKGLKEEQYQGEFLEDLFVKILGYTKPASSSETKFNLTTEYKNVKDSKKADGAIIINDTVKAVIELKGTNTTDLGKIESQAFGYKNNQPECIYVITSNFEKLRFYIDNAIEHIEFNLFTLTEKEFELLYLCLGYNNMENNIGKKIKEESISQEDIITKKLYKDYSLFKRELHLNLTELNPDYDPIELFKKSQKLIDRFLFLFFGEDRHLLPPNSVRLILSDWRDLQERDVEIPLYDRFKKYFEYLNTGYKGKRYDVFAYNGGLFKPDEILDVIKIDDELLYRHTFKLAEYDFVSEVDVNILGHIFENSLNELDEVKAQLEGTEVDKTKTRRKKDGVFYTPKYITKYIVDNTIGKLCAEKKVELNIIEEDYISTMGFKPLAKKTKQPLLEKLTTYRNWLLQLTICDPACGSGAFLNQALDFLITEHKYIDELQAKLFGDALILSDVEKSILENNLFGVDLNEESVEIAKLSLWLRTAQPNRKLNDLNNNIKCGNSLIDDVAIAGEKAFNWQTAFPKIFKEKQKKTWHITTAIHDSRTSQRMIDYKVREKRALGTIPEPKVNYLTDNDEMVIAETVAVLVIEQNLNILAFNVCKDHIHIVLVCEEEEVSEIVRKIKGRTAREVNQNKGFKPLVQKEGEKSIPLWTQKFGCKEIVDENQLANTIQYIKTNRAKHNLPDNSNKGFKPLVERIVCTHEHAFRAEYKGGFDVIIGNPPYVQIQSMGTISNDLEKRKFETFEKTGDLYCLFYELGHIILKDNGLLGFITSNKWMRANYGNSLRNYLIEKTQPIELLDLGSGIFDSATVDSNILIFEKTLKNNKPFIGLDISKQKYFIDFIILESQKVEINPKRDTVWSISSKNEQALKYKFDTLGAPLKNWEIQINRGVLTGLTEAYIIDEDKKNELILKNIVNKELLVPVLRGRDVNRYQIDYRNSYLINSHNGYKGVPKIDIENYVDIKTHLEQFEPQLSKRYDKGDTPFNLRNCAYLDAFLQPKIIWKEMSSETPFVIDKNGYFANDTITFITGKNLEYLLSLLNSKLCFYIFSKYYSGGGLGSTGIRFKKEFLSNLPLKQIVEENQTPFIENADLMLSLNKELQVQSQKFQRTLQRKFFSTADDKGFKPLVESVLPKKLQDWYLLSYPEFIKELGKQKIKLTLSQEAEWEEYFTTEAKKVTAIKTQIDTTDKAIDAMVYELYGLSAAEIAIVESSN